MQGVFGPIKDYQIAYLQMCYQHAALNSKTPIASIDTFFGKHIEMFTGTSVIRSKPSLLKSVLQFASNSGAITPNHREMLKEMQK